MRQRTLLTQVLAVNTALVAVTAFVAAVVARERLNDAVSSQGLLLIGLAVLAVVLLNSLLLRRRLEPMSRLEHERRESGRAVLRAQEQERSRIAQDLHDEVNQALTGILLRLEATMADAPPHLVTELADTKALATQAMEELLHLARELRPTALDDHGLVPALASQIATFSERTGIRSRFTPPLGQLPALTDEEQLVIYRVTQESLSNVVQHAGASRVDVELNTVGRTVLRVRERALLVGGNLAIFSTPGEGTTIELTMGAT